MGVMAFSRLHSTRRLQVPQMPNSISLGSSGLGRRSGLWYRGSGHLSAGGNAKPGQLGFQYPVY